MQIIITINIEILNEVSILFFQKTIFPYCDEYFQLKLIHTEAISTGMDLRLRIFASAEATLLEKFYYIEEITLGNCN